MKVLISWSGIRSKAVAESLHYWLKSVIQSIEPWMSEEDIKKGTRWNSELASELEKTRVGIICLTPENLNEPWILFEAGALSKTLENTFVCPYLFKIEKAELKGPLSQFQVTKAIKDDTKKLLTTINNASDVPLTEIQLDDAFRRWWPKLYKRLKGISDNGEPPERKMTMRDLPLGDAIERSGLVDIENRDDKQFELPPTKFYEQAKREIFITGPSLYRTFDKQSDFLNETLQKNIKVYMMILHPDSDDVKWLTDREGRAIQEDIKATIGTIKIMKFHKDPGFQIKFIMKLPPFIGVMIDGDISPKSKTPLDNNGQVRIQPNNIYVTGHKGLIIQLMKIPAINDQPAGPFDFFSGDFREIWKNDAKEYPQFFVS